MARKGKVDGDAIDQGGNGESKGGYEIEPKTNRASGTGSVARDGDARPPVAKKKENPVKRKHGNPFREALEKVKK